MQQIQMTLMAYFWIWFAVGLTLVTGLVLLSKNPKWNDLLAFGVIMSGLFVAWIALHPRQTALLEGTKTVQAAIGSGQPVLLEFQSPYCIVCTELKPVVDELEQELGDRVQIIRINIHESVGHQLAPLLGIEFAPTFVFFDAQGGEAWREIGSFDPQKVRDSISQ
jgi:thioredoxin 1